MANGWYFVSGLQWLMQLLIVGRDGGSMILHTPCVQAARSHYPYSYLDGSVVDRTPNIIIPLVTIGRHCGADACYGKSVNIPFWS